MKIGSGDHVYTWVDDWARIPPDEAATKGWSHHDAVVRADGRIVSCHQGKPTILSFDPDGNVVDSCDAQITEAHGMSIASEGDGEVLWIGDTGRKRLAEINYDYPDDAKPSEAVKLDFAGNAMMRIGQPDLDIYTDGPFSVTSVAVHQEKHGGNGDIWVADGYGQSWVHRYTKDGEYLGSINGEESGVGRFNTPHGLLVDYRKADPELYIADRANNRVMVYDLEGNFKRKFGEDWLITPCTFAVAGDLLAIPELQARVTLVDPDDNLAGQLGDNTSVAQREGWPNVHGHDGNLERPHDLEPGKFNSPHGIAADAEGNLYVPEWLIGGRFTKLVRD